MLVLAGNPRGLADTRRRDRVRPSTKKPASRPQTMDHHFHVATRQRNVPGALIEGGHVKRRHRRRKGRWISRRKRERARLASRTEKPRLGAARMTHAPGASCQTTVLALPRPELAFFFSRDARRDRRHRFLEAPHVLPEAGGIFERTP